MKTTHDVHGLRTTANKISRKMIVSLLAICRRISFIGICLLCTIILKMTVFLKLNYTRETIMHCNMLKTQDSFVLLLVKNSIKQLQQYSPTPQPTCSLFYQPYNAPLQTGLNPFVESLLTPTLIATPDYRILPLH